MKLKGSCHCGQVKYEVDTTNLQLIRCNCSICTKKGALHLRVKPEQFNLLQGQADLEEYRFGTAVARHFFCPICGIHTHSNPRSAPEQYSINAHCLDDFYSLAWEYIEFDGQHWEEAMAKAQK